MTKGMAIKRFLAAMGFIAAVHLIFFVWTWSWGFSNNVNGPGWLCRKFFTFGDLCHYQYGKLHEVLAGDSGFQGSSFPHKCHSL
ncbi:hypothetical protein, partial [Brucella tritici]|uniref:hypothetical protein n=1 Tax=Brucella tritici TaxID=94626 RepID=UPI001AEEC647